MDHVRRSGHSRPGPASFEGSRPGAAARRSGAVGAALAVLAVAAAGACAPDADRSSAERRERETGFRGIVLPEPPRMPEVVLADTDGEPFDLRARTRGSVTLLFFGYTHCPDVCPVQMTNLAAVLDELRPSQRSRIQVIFVSTDPERDTPERLRSWLDRRDSTFVGLRGPMEEVNAAQSRLGLAPAMKQDGTEEGDGYLVGHASQVLAFTPDGRARLAYPFGTRQVDWMHDLPILLRQGWPEDG